MSEPESTNSENSDLLAIIKFGSGQSIVGISVSVISALIHCCLKRTWSALLFLYTASPIVWYAMIYAVIAIYVKVRHNRSVPFISKKMIPLYMICVTAFICISHVNYLTNARENVEFGNVNLNELSAISQLYGDTETYFVIFGSQNCTHCHQIDTIYKEAFAASPEQYVYYVDLTYESLNSPSVQTLEISNIPLIVSYRQNNEVGRLAGC